MCDIHRRVSSVSQRPSSQENGSNGGLRLQREDTGLSGPTIVDDLGPDVESSCSDTDSDGDYDSDTSVEIPSCSDPGTAELKYCDDARLSAAIEADNILLVKRLINFSKDEAEVSMRAFTLLIDRKIHIAYSITRPSPLKPLHFCWPVNGEIYRLSRNSFAYKPHILSPIRVVWELCMPPLAPSKS